MIHNSIGKMGPKVPIQSLLQCNPQPFVWASYNAESLQDHHNNNINHLQTYIYTYTYTYTYTYIHTCICIYRYMHVYTIQTTYKYIYRCMCMYIYIYIFIVKMGTAEQHVGTPWYGPYIRPVALVRVLWPVLQRVAEVLDQASGSPSSPGEPP